MDNFASKIVTKIKEEINKLLDLIEVEEEKTVALDLISGIDKTINASSDEDLLIMLLSILATEGIITYAESQDSTPTKYS